MLKEANCDVNSTTSDGETPLSLVRSHDTDIIKELIRYGANPKNVYLQYTRELPQQCSKQPAESAAKVFILGYPGAGKSSLTAALKCESTGTFSRLMNRFAKVKVEVKTAGIIPHKIESGTFGHVTIYDFAGHEEFYAGHNSFLKNAVTGSTAAVFIVVVDLRESDEEFRQTLLFWLTFIQNQYSSTESKSHVIIICSHADKVKSEKQEASAKLRVVNSLLKNAESSDPYKIFATISPSIESICTFPSLCFAGLVVMNCLHAESESMSELRQIMAKSCDTLRTEMIMSFNSHCFFLYLLDKFRKELGVTLCHVLSSAQSESEIDRKELLRFIPDSVHGLCNVCEELNQRGNLLFLKNVQYVGDSWIVLDQEALLCKVSGTVFAPEDFKQHQELTTTSTGVVPLSKMAACFHNLDTNLDIDLIALFLCHLEFCHEIKDHRLLPLLQGSSGSSFPEERYFFFPALVITKEPDKIWETNDDFCYHFAWTLKCFQPEHFFLPRFLQVLLLRLAFGFALASDKPGSESSSLPVICRKCCVWKNGIFWVNRFGVEVLVEVVDKSREVNVMVRCVSDGVIHCAQLRAAVISKVLDIKNEYCPWVSVTESFIPSTEARKYPLNTSDEVLIAAKEVANAILQQAPYAIHESGNKVELHKLLLFEPYANLGNEVLCQLFAKENAREKVDEKFFGKLWKLPLDSLKYMFLNSTTESIDDTRQVYQLWQQHSEGTYQCLRQTLDAFSVFSGRNPLVSHLPGL